MNATDELRRMLDERGVEWESDGSGFRVMWGQPVPIDQMQFKAVDNALPNGGLNISICGFSPEQAIAATLGAGTCRMIYDEEASGDELWPTEAYHCSECGKWVYAGKPNYCPSCGRKVEG